MEPYIPESKSNSIVEDIYIPTTKNIKEEKNTDQDWSSPTSTSSESSNSSTSTSSLSQSSEGDKLSGSSVTVDVTKPSESLQPSESNSDPCYRKTTNPRTVTGKRKQSSSDKEKNKHKKQKKE